VLSRNRLSDIRDLGGTLRSCKNDAAGAEAGNWRCNFPEECGTRRDPLEARAHHPLGAVSGGARGSITPGRVAKKVAASGPAWIADGGSIRSGFHRRQGLLMNILDCSIVGIFLEGRVSGVIAGFRWEYYCVAEKEEMIRGVNANSHTMQAGPRFLPRRGRLDERKSLRAINPKEQA